MASSVISKLIFHDTSDHTSSAVSVPASGMAVVNIDITKTGYTPIRVGRVQTDKGATVIIAGYQLTNNTLSVIMRNFSTSAISTVVYYSIIYIKA